MHAIFSEVLNHSMLPSPSNYLQDEYPITSDHQLFQPIQSQNLNGKKDENEGKLFIMVRMNDNILSNVN